MKEQEKLPKEGRPTKYDPANNEIVTNYCLMGATDKELGDFLGVCEATINNWKIEHPKFLESIKKGKELADARVSRALYNRATGYDHNDKHYPADATSAIFWLKNRRPNDWRDKKDVSVTLDKQVFKIGDQEFEI